MSEAKKSKAQTRAMNWLADMQPSKTSDFLNLEADSGEKNSLPANTDSDKGTESVTEQPIDEKIAEKKSNKQSRGSTAESGATPAKSTTKDIAKKKAPTKKEKSPSIDKSKSSSIKQKGRDSSQGRYQQENGVTYYVDDRVPDFLKQDLENMIAYPEVKTIPVGSDIHKLIKVTSDLSGVPIKYIVAIAMQRFVDQHTEDFKELAAKRWSF